MSEHKQSFLERLTGVQKLSDQELPRKDQRQIYEDGPQEKPWSPIIDEEEETQEYTTETPEEEEEEEEGDATLAIDMYESDNELIIQSMIAGITPENLHISITRDSVTLSGRRIAPNGVPDEQYAIRELFWGAFSREIKLPFEINTDGAEAIEKYGLLIIRLPKLDTHHTHELKVKSIQ